MKLNMFKRVEKRQTLRPTYLKSYENAVFTYEITVDYLELNDREGIKRILAEKVTRKMEEFIDSVIQVDKIADLPDPRGERIDDDA